MSPPVKKGRREEEVLSSEVEMAGGKEEDFTGSSSGVCSSYSLYCTVSQNDYFSKDDWLQHLGTPEHQNLARVECLRTWGEDKKMRECVVVVFCSFPLTFPGTVEELLERFSSSGVDSFVTDFVWWPERPRLGFLQFESRRKVAEILNGLENGSNGFVQDKLVQLKKAVDILDLEWKELLPPEAQSFGVPGSPAGSSILKSSSDASTAVKSLSSVSSPLISASCHIPVPRTPLQRQFNSICLYIEIPEAEFEHAVQIASRIKQVLRKDHPTGEVAMLRNYYLRLRNNGNDLLLLYVYIPESSSFPSSFGFPGQKEEAILFTELVGHLSGYQRVYLDQCPVEGHPFRNFQTGFRFNLTGHFDSIWEVQLCRLLQYLCTFDPRVRPVLALVHFWAKAQNVRVAQEHIPKAIVHSNCPEPASLDWMVILFLIKEGTLPSVRDIQRRPHKPLLLDELQADIGFSCDLDYAREWTRGHPPPEVNSDRFLWSVLKLTQQCFHFYSTRLGEGCWVLNPRDGEILRRERKLCPKGSLTEEEISVLNAGKRRLKVSNFPIYVINPLYVKWKLSFCNETWRDWTCQKMMCTAQALQTYINFLEIGTVWETGLTLDSILAGVRTNRP